MHLACLLLLNILDFSCTAILLTAAVVVIYHSFGLSSSFEKMKWSLLLYLSPSSEYRAHLMQGIVLGFCTLLEMLSLAANLISTVA